MAFVGLAAFSGTPAIAQSNPPVITQQQVDDVESPLAPPEMGSPRQTLLSLRKYTKKATDDFVQAFALSKASGRFLDTPEISALKRRSLANMRRASETLDLTGVPPASRQNAAITSALLLKEILDRVSIPDAALIPGLEDVKSGKIPDGWRLPGTEIYMEQSAAADGSPIFRFSPETISNLRRYYERVAELPTNDPRGLDFYLLFKTAPGLELPISVHRAVQALPQWTQSIYWQQATWKWIAICTLTLVLVGFFLWLSRHRAADAQTVGSQRRVLRWFFMPLLLIALLIGYRELLTSVINLSGEVLSSIELALKILITLLGAWATVLLFVLLAEFLLATPRINRESLDGSMIRLAFKVLGIAAAGYILTIGAAQVGIPIYGLVAGIGVGGLAIALAIRPTLENLIAGIILYSDRPVRIGDFCQFGEMLGTVETIGLRSAKIRALDRTLITIQNADFVQMQIVNFTRRDANLFNPTIGLVYETTTEQIEAIIERTREMLLSHPQVKADTVRVNFRRFGAYSLDIEMSALVELNNWAEFLAVQEELLMKFRTIVEEAGSSFAFPSQTTYFVANAPAEGTEGATLQGSLMQGPQTKDS